MAAAAEEPPFFPEDDLEARIAEVSEGELEFLDTPPTRPVHHHKNLIRITAASLEDGWVTLEQCHRHLDPVPLVEIVYHPQRIRNIQVLSTRNIGASRVVDAKIELRDIRQDAELCLRADSRSLHSMGDGAFQLRNGPYMRRFLDGYYPMRLTIAVHYPAAMIRFSALRPLPVDAEQASETEGVVRWDGWFQGRLFTELDFNLIQDN
ncbi:MAG: hypothetical protein KZQ88_00375 [Candidatus Thiodiazotropha sp. (ex Dulcina madagascariensis)]|nr:hypothetical protein [Candidatus Thiodiazotropha sp. (ex Dulcina madagascariensis)]MCU7928021.1 hypothetical protein [Candidatus Thiodiazotropha sp. (ex Dulcina madagascariensis)]